MKQLIFALITSLILLTACGHSMDHGHHDDHTAHGGMNMIDAHAHLLGANNVQAGEEAKITYQINNEADMPLQGMIEHHGRKVHVLFIGEDLDTVGHVHPEDFGGITTQMEATGRYPVMFTFPKAGKYITAVDVMTGEGHFSENFHFKVKGEPKMSVPVRDVKTQKCFKSYELEGVDVLKQAVSLSSSEIDCSEGYTVQFFAPEHIHAGDKAVFNYRFEKDGKPLTDMQPFLDAAIHLAIVKDDLDVLLHRHGTIKGMNGHNIPETFGPDLVSEEIVFPEAGTYKIISQTKHDGNVIFSHFMVDVTEDHEDSH